MSEHVSEWLGPYLDGELRGSRLHQVEKHLTECQACRAELQSLRSLSTFLHEIPAPEFTSPERFSTQVNLRLPRELPRAAKRKVQEAGWWMIPVGLTMMWIFVSALGLFSDVLGTAREWGLANAVPAWLVPGASSGTFWSGTLEEFGLLSGSGLEFAQAMESFSRSTLPQIIWQVSIALLYLGWIAVWWTRHTRQGHGQLLEG